MKIEKQLGRFEDSIAYWFNLGYSDIDLYSLTTIDAYRTPTAKILTKEALEDFLKTW